MSYSRSALSRAVHYLSMDRVMSSPAFFKLRRKLGRRGMTDTEVDRVLTDMYRFVVLGFGDSAISGKLDTLAEITDLRERIERLYHQELSFGRGKTSRVDTRQRIGTVVRDLRDLYSQLDEKLIQLGASFEEVVPPPDLKQQAKSRTLREIADIESSRTTGGKRSVHRDVRENRLVEDFNFEKVGDAFVLTFADGATTEFRIKNGQYHVIHFDKKGRQMTAFTEFQILRDPYARKPRVSGIMQAHHGMQNARVKKLFEKFGYDGDAAPTIWLRDSKTGSPHGRITSTQDGRPERIQTLDDIRVETIADLKAIGMPDTHIYEYLDVFDEYFKKVVLPQLVKEGGDALDLLGPEYRARFGV